MKLIRRNCPICKVVDYDELVLLRQEDFTRTNPTYQLDKIGELGLDPNQVYPIVKCRQCKMIYSLYHLDDETEALVYNRIIDSDISLDKVLTISRRISDLRRWLQLLTLTGNTRSGKVDLTVMDYGCGWGTLLLAAQGPGIQVVGFDMTERKVAWARSQGLTICTSIEDLKAYAPFDIAISTYVLEHVRSPRDVVAEIASLLRPKSYILMTCIIPYVAQETGWSEVRKLLSHGYPLPKDINPWEHYNYFTVESLSRLLENSGIYPVLRSPESIVQSLKHMLKTYRAGLSSKPARFRPGQPGHFPKSIKIIPEYWQLKGP